MNPDKGTSSPERETHPVESLLMRRKRFFNLPRVQGILRAVTDGDTETFDAIKRESVYGFTGATRGSFTPRCYRYRPLPSGALVGGLFHGGGFFGRGSRPALPVHSMCRCF